MDSTVFSREGKKTVGRKLLDVPGYTYRVWVTNRTEPAVEIWRDYNGRATVEQRIKQALKTGNPIAPLLARPPTPEEKWSELACGECSI